MTPLARGIARAIPSFRSTATVVERAYSPKSPALCRKTATAAALDRSWKEEKMCGQLWGGKVEFIHQFSVCATIARQGSVCRPSELEQAETTPSFFALRCRGAP